MLFLEDLYATKRPYPKPDRRSSGRQPRAQRREPPIAAPETPRKAPEASAAPTAPVEQHETASSTKRNSFFSRRKSTATNSSTESPKRNSSAHSGGAGSQRSSVAEAPADGEGSKGSKYLFGLHSSKKSRKSDPQAKSEADRGRSGHSRGASADSVKESFANSVPFGFHSIGFDRSRGASKDQFPLPQGPPFVSSPPDELQSSLARRVQRRPPPLRPKRPDDTLIPQELLSPQYGVPSLRQIRSAEAVGPPPLRPAPLPPGEPRIATAPLPPRRSSKMVSPSLSDDIRGMQYGNRQLDANRDWERATALYDLSQPQQPKARPLPIHGNLPPTPGSGNPQVPAPLPSPLFSPPLAQVPEEPEGVNSPRRRRSKDSSRMASIRHAKSTPNISRSASQTKLAPIARGPDRPSSQGSDTLGELAFHPVLAKCGEAVKRFGFPKSGSASWEDDIDFCYDNSAEANCEFDWTGVPKFVEMESSDDDRWAAEEIIMQRKLSLGHQPNSSMDSSSSDEESLTKSIRWPRAKLPNAESPPELDFQSVQSSSSNSLAARTPRDPFRFPSNEGLRQQLASQRKAETTSPQLPQLALKTDNERDNMYEDLMVGFNVKDAQPLPTLEPKTYTRPGQPGKRISPLLSHRAYNIGAPPSMGLPPLPTSLPLPPTSQPASSTGSPALSSYQSPTSAYGSPSLSSAFGKDLPPLPPIIPKSSRGTPPTVDSIVARLRTPTESPVDPRMHPFTPPHSNKSSPVPYYMTQSANSAGSRWPQQRTESPIAKLQQQQQGFPEVLSRNGSEDTVVTTIFVPPSPPQSPADLPPHQLSAASTATTARSGPSSAGSSKPPSSARNPADGGGGVRDRLPLLPQLSVPEAAPKRSASDAGAASPVSAVSVKPQTATDPKQGYSLFPQSPRPTRPRRGTTA